jgi:hypothetical protein
MVGMSLLQWRLVTFTDIFFTVSAVACALVSMLKTVAAQNSAAAIMYLFIENEF